MVLVAIIACEIAFWVVLVSGLALRYPMRRPRLGLAVLASVPLVDVVLLAVTAWDLHRGGTPSPAHAVSAIYLGISLAYGHKLIRWMDEKFAVRYNGATPRPRLWGREYTKECWADVLRTLLAAGIAAAVTWGLVSLAGDPSAVEVLEENYAWLRLILIIDVLWAVSYTLWPRRPKDQRPGSHGL